MVRMMRTSRRVSWRSRRRRRILKGIVSPWQGLTEAWDKHVHSSGNAKHTHHRASNCNTYNS